MIRRIGQFFFWWGVFLIFLFFVSDVMQETDFTFLLVGLVVLFLGLLMIRRGREDRREPRRFRLLRSIFSRRARDEEEEE